MTPTPQRPTRPIREGARRRQRAVVAQMLDQPETEPEPEGAEGPDAEPAPPPKTMEEIVLELTIARRPPVPDGKPVEFLCFVDRTMQVAGMQSGDQLTAKVQPNGRRHTIEFIEGLNVFLVGYIDPERGKAEFEFIERTAVRRWKPAIGP
jgi:hypothetical protein